MKDYFLQNENRFTNVSDCGGISILRITTITCDVTIFLPILQCSNEKSSFLQYLGPNHVFIQMDGSDSFAVLNDSDAETEIVEGDWTPDFRKNQERQRLIKRILKLCGKDEGGRKPLNVVIIGPAGVGKSAFINSLAAALGGDRWREYAYSGSHGSDGGQVTVFTTSFEKCCKSEKYGEYLLPTLIDVAGFHDQQGEEFIELLRIVFYGRLPEGESLAEAAQYYKDKGLEGLRTKYSQNNEKLKVDRVLFLTSATQLVPENLINCVVQAARPPGTKTNPKKRTIPLFGVMLKFDKVVTKEEYERRKSSVGSDLTKLDVIEEEEYEKRELKFIHALGLGGSKHRFLRCSNYCDDVDKGNTRVESVIPDLDLPILRLFTQVADPVIKVHNESETYEGGKRKQGEEPEVEQDPDVQKPDTTQDRRTPERRSRQSPLLETFGENMASIMLISVEALFVAFILTVLLKPPIDMAKLKAVCRFSKEHSDNSQMDDICNDVENVSLSSQFSFIIALVSLVLIRAGATFATVRLFRQ